MEGEALETVLDVFDEVLREAGSNLPVAAGGNATGRLLVGLEPAGHRLRLKATRPVHVLESRSAGRLTATLPIGPTMRIRARNLATTFLRPYLRLNARDAQIRREGSEGTWAYALGEVAAAILTGRGIDPEGALAAARARRDGLRIVGSEVRLEEAEIGGFVYARKDQISSLTGSLPSRMRGYVNLPELLGDPTLPPTPTEMIKVDRLEEGDRLVIRERMVLLEPTPPHLGRPWLEAA